MTRTEELELIRKEGMDILALKEVDPDSLLIEVWDAVDQVIGDADETWTIISELHSRGIRFEVESKA